MTDVFNGKNMKFGDNTIKTEVTIPNDVAIRTPDLYRYDKASIYNYGKIDSTGFYGCNTSSGGIFMLDGSSITPAENTL